MGVKNNGGGNFNHSLFWEIIGPSGSDPEGELKEAIKESFGGFGKFKEIFTQVSLGRFGSGWVWLCKDDKGVHVCSTANQDNCYTSTEGMSCGQGDCQPILTIDLWEHAYYLKYQNRREEYVKNFFKVIDWRKVQMNYEGVKN